MDMEDRRLEILERETRIKERELELKIAEAGKSAWRSPLVVAILAAAVAALGNAWTAYYNSEANLQAQTKAAENARILQMLKADTEQAAANLQFLIATSLITDPNTRSSITTFLASREPGTGPSLAPPPPPDNRELELLAEALAPEIRDGSVSVAYLDANFILVRMPTDVVFPQGGSDLSAQFENDIAPRLAQAIAKVDTLVRQARRDVPQLIVLAHTDARSASASDATGQALSAARAERAKQAIAAHLSKDRPMIAKGRGTDDPLCGPATNPDCWSANSRIELLIERTL